MCIYMYIYLCIVIGCVFAAVNIIIISFNLMYVC